MGWENGKTGWENRIMGWENRKSGCFNSKMGGENREMGCKNREMGSENRQMGRPNRQFPDFFGGFSLIPNPSQPHPPFGHLLQRRREAEDSFWRGEQSYKLLFRAAELQARDLLKLLFSDSGNRFYILFNLQGKVNQTCFSCVHSCVAFRKGI